MQRDTFANLFHDSEDFFNLFLTLAMLELSLDNIVLLILDLYPKGPFFDVWTRAFSNGQVRKLLWADGSWWWAR